MAGLPGRSCRTGAELGVGCQPSCQVRQEGRGLAAAKVAVRRAPRRPNGMRKGTSESHRAGICVMS